MAQPPFPGGVLMPAEPHLLLVEGETVFVQAKVAEYLLGDTCVLIETGDHLRVSKFWVPTRNIHRCAPAGAAPMPPVPEVPEYTLVDAAHAYGWQLRPVTKP